MAQLIIPPGNYGGRQNKQDIITNLAQDEAERQRQSSGGHGRSSRNKTTPPIVITQPASELMSVSPNAPQIKASQSTQRTGSAYFPGYTVNYMGGSYKVPGGTYTTTGKFYPNDIGYLPGGSMEVYSTPNIPAIQRISQEEQDRQRALQQFNVITQRNALQRDQNYSLKTKPEETKKGPLSFLGQTALGVSELIASPLISLGKIQFKQQRENIFSFPASPFNQVKTPLTEDLTKRQNEYIENKFGTGLAYQKFASVTPSDYLTASFLPLGFIAPGAMTAFGIGYTGGVQVPRTIKNPTPENVAGSLVGAFGSIVGLREVSLFGKKPYKVTPTLEMEQSIQPFTRQRVSLFLQDEKGNYILGRTKEGELISIGGGIEKGQTPKTALFSELKQETGLTNKDIIDFTPRGKIVFPEETHYVYTAKLKPGTNIKASSDIMDITTISPKNPFIKGSTGQTSFQPTSRYVPFKGNIRAYETGIINFLETGQKPTWLAVKSSMGEFYLGTQSRYNVPFTSQKQYIGQDSLLAHGTINPSDLKYFSFGKSKEFPILGGKTKRGQAQGLYVQPPIKPGKNSPGYIGLSYLGFKTSQPSESISFGFPKRAVYLFDEKIGKSVIPTPKTYSGMESEFIIPPESRISINKKYDVFSIGLKKVRLQPAKISTSGKTINEFNILASESSRSYINPIKLSSSLSFFKQSTSSKSSISSRSSSMSFNILHSQSINYGTKPSISLIPSISYKPSIPIIPSYPRYPSTPSRPSIPSYPYYPSSLI